MIRPTRDEFRALAERYSVVPVWQEYLADLTTPVAAFSRVVGNEPGFLLESVEHGERWGRWSFIGRRPTATIVARGGHIEVGGTLPAGVPLDQGVLAAVEAVLAAYRSPPPSALPALAGLPPLHGGIVGYLGYDVVREIERLPHVPPDELGYPDAILSIIGQLAAYDHWRQRVTLIDSVPLTAGAHDADRRYDEAVARLHQMALDGTRALEEPLVEPPTREDELPAVRRRTSSSQYADAVAVAKEHILAGDAFQVVLAQRFDLDLDAESFDVYRALRQVNPSPYMYFLHHDELDVIGSSPEPMVQLLDGRVISRPIAGTRRRGRTEEEDRRMAGELTEHPKEIAEHVMLVDLARNDVGRVVSFGTEQVDELLTLERYSHVMHLTSQVSGGLRPGLGPIDVLRATLPAGTVSGAPKVRAMELIDELEPVKRGPYAGVVGYLDFSGNIDTAIAIRTMLVAPGGRASVTAGAGVVADSDPAQEDLECRNKAAALLAAVPGARRITAARRAASVAAPAPS
ncbi:MAG TPA: chorismate-binding protein [Acidimicrobiales bacterium]|nr:chorismate-binding protein [Acidimicrobiales bacterium]